METVRQQLIIQKANQLFKTYQEQITTQDKRYDTLVEAIQLYRSVAGSLPAEQRYAPFSFFISFLPSL
jgi:hypothetical protein